MAHWFFLFLWFNILSNTLSRYFFCSVFSQKDGASVNTNWCLPQFCIRQKQRRRGGAVTPLLEVQTLLEGGCWRHVWAKGRSVALTPGRRGSASEFPISNVVRLWCSSFRRSQLSYGLILLHFWNQMPFLQTLAKTGHLGSKSDCFPKTRGPVQSRWHVCYSQKQGPFLLTS